MEIPPQTIDNVVRPYQVECRVLREARLEYPRIYGKFFIGSTFYHVPTLQHVTDIEIQLCLNQLAYAGIAQAIQYRSIPELDDLSFEQLRKEGMLIIESRKRFRKQIPTCREISGQMNVNEWRDEAGLIRGWANFQFENRSCFGSLELALVKSNGERK